MRRPAIRLLAIALCIGACGRTAFRSSTSGGGGGGGGGGGFTNPTPPSGYDAWTHRRHVTVVGTGVTASLSNFPVPVVMGTELASAAAGGADLRVFDDGGIAIPYEIEEWTPAQSVLWVSVPSLAQATGAGFWIYYGNATASSAQTPTLVFSDFIAVWHLGPSLTASTGPVNDLFGTTTDAAGKLGRGRYFDGSVNAILSAHDNASLNPTAALTASAWVNSLDWASGNHRVLEKGDNDDQYRFMCENNQLKLDLKNIGTTASSSLPATQQWHHVASTYDGNKARLYVDGVEVQNNSMNGAIQVSTFDLHIGAKQPSGVAGDHFFGTLDEVRLSATARSAAWIRAEYLSGAGGMVHLGPEEAR